MGRSEGLDRYFQEIEEREAYNLSQATEENIEKARQAHEIAYRNLVNFQEQNPDEWNLYMWYWNQYMLNAETTEVREFYLMLLESSRAYILDAEESEKSGRYATLVNTLAEHNKGVIK